MGEQIDRKPFVAIDFETANEQRRSACALGMVKYGADGQLVDTYYSLIHPHPDVDYFNPINIFTHGITPQDVADAPQWDSIAEEVRSFISDLPIVAHNMAFDGYVMADLMDLYDLAPLPNRRLCTLRIARKILADKIGSKSLDNVYEHYFPNEHFEHHQAFQDAQAAGRIFIRMEDEYGYAQLEELCSVGRNRNRAHSGLHTDWKNVADLVKLYEGTQAIIDERVCITGTLKSGQRSAVQELIGLLGGVSEKSLTKRTTMLVVGIPNPAAWAEGSSSSKKLEKAKALRESGANIQILSEEEFFNLLGDES